MRLLPHGFHFHNWLVLVSFMYLSYLTFHVYVCCVVLSCSVVSDFLCDPMDGTPPGSLVHGILQARMLDLPHPGMEPTSPVLQMDSLPTPFKKIYNKNESFHLSIIFIKSCLCSEIPVCRLLYKNS